MHRKTQKIHNFFHKNTRKSKHDHEWTVDLTDFDDVGVVGKLTVPAFQRRQARKNPLGLRSIRGHVLIPFFHKFYKNPHFLSTEVAREDNRHPKVHQLKCDF